MYLVQRSAGNVQIFSSFLRNSQNQSSGETGQEFAICKHCETLRETGVARVSRLQGVQALCCKRLWLCEGVVSVVNFSFCTTAAVRCAMDCRSGTRD